MILDTTKAPKHEVGDYDKRGPDYETLLVGPITEIVGDADRYVRRPLGRDGLGFDNGFPRTRRTFLTGALPGSPCTR